mgnify:CR=1 FL=1
MRDSSNYAFLHTYSKKCNETNFVIDHNLVQVEGEPDKTGQDDTPDVDDDNYACVKVVLGRTAYRSCVPKYSEIRLNCTTGPTMSFYSNYTRFNPDFVSISFGFNLDKSLIKSGEGEFLKKSGKIWIK